MVGSSDFLRVAVVERAKDEDEQRFQNYMYLEEWPLCQLKGVVTIVIVKRVERQQRETRPPSLLGKKGTTRRNKDV